MTGAPGLFRIKKKKKNVLFRGKYIRKIYARDIGRKKMCANNLSDKTCIKNI